MVKMEEEWGCDGQLRLVPFQLQRDYLQIRPQ